MKNGSIHYGNVTSAGEDAWYCYFLARLGRSEFCGKA